MQNTQILLVNFSLNNLFVKKYFNISVDINFQSKSGHYLSAVDYPLLYFYAFMLCIYLIYAIFWSIISFIRWKELLQIQFYIATVILIGMIEKATFYGVYQSLNANGISNQKLIYFVEVISCVKRTLARFLLLVVSCGFEIIRYV